MSDFLALQIPFSEQNHCSVFFAHLQNTLKSIRSTSSSEIQKVNHIIYDIYIEHQKLQQSYNSISKSTKQMMTQFSTVLNQCKDDRQQLMKVTNDRSELLQKLKQSNEQSIELEQDNSTLRQAFAKVKQINALLTQKNQIIEGQLANRAMAQVGVESFNRISKQYDRLLASNTQIRKQLHKVYGQSQMIQEMSKPMQIIDRALKNNPQLKDQIWTTANPENAQPTFIPLNVLKEKFYSFDFQELATRIKQEYQ